MNRRTLAAWLLALLPGLAAAAPPPAGPPAAPAPPAVAAPAAQPGQWESYRILSERNIFLRNRSRPSSGRAAPSAHAVVSNGDDRIVLTGIIQQGQDYLAFVEDTRTGKTAMAQVGDTLGRGRLAAVTLDAIQYTCDGKTARIAIGSNLTGAAVTFAKPAAAPSAKAAPAATPTAAPSAGATPAAATPAAATPAAATATAATPAAATPPAPTQAAESAPAATPTAAAASTTQPPAAPPQAAAGKSGSIKDSGAADIAERMRRRREQELNK
jgi:hypothetical protein